MKNTGRCKELLIPGCTVYLTASDNPARKTKYDLVAVVKSNGLLINIDSQAPNKVALEYLHTQNYDVIIPEYTFGASRIDFYMERHSAGKTEKYLMEVKGCTLERSGIGYFPDAPTERGVKHLHELIKAKEEGYNNAILAFVIQMDGIREVHANVETHPEFGAVLEEAVNAGVRVLSIPCHVEPDELKILPGFGFFEKKQ